MALGMRQWLGFVAAGFAFVALETLPPRATELPEPQDPPLQAERRRDALRGEALRAATLLQRMRWADSIIPATLSGEGPVVFSFPEGTRPEQEEMIRSRTLSELPGSPSDVATGIFFLPLTVGAVPGAPVAARTRAEYYFGEREGRPYCVIARPVWRQSADDRVVLPTVMSDESYLGLCELIRAHGLPGPAVRAWLAGGGADLALSARPGRGTQLTYVSLSDAYRPRILLGLRNSLWARSTRRLSEDRCFYGIAEGCAEMFLQPRLRAYSGLAAQTRADILERSPVSATQEGSLFEPADYHVVADLAEEFGPDRFQQWWTADGDVLDAFAASFGVDAGAWNLDRISSFVEIGEPGPVVSRAGMLASLLLISAASALAGAWALRRRVA